MKIDIIGTGLTASFYDWPDGHEKWSVGSAFPAYGSKIDLYFCFHGEPVDHFVRSDIGYFDKHNYPLDAVRDYFGSTYFTNSIGYMLALAIKKKPKEISIWGIDMEHGGEYSFERPCVAYWIGQAEGRGIKVSSSSGLAQANFLYGYENLDLLMEQMKMRKAHAEVMIEKSEGPERDQWIGKMVAIRDMINIARS